MIVTFYTTLRHNYKYASGAFILFVMFRKEKYRERTLWECVFWMGGGRMSG